MNRVYKVIWSKAKHCYVVTSEIARSVTKSASSARSAGRKGAAVLAMAALLFTAGGVLGEAANVVTDVSGSSAAQNLIIVTKDDGNSTNFSINNVEKAQEADHAKEADYATAATKATSDGSGHVIENTYVKNVDARVGADGEYVKKDKTVGENLSALDTNLSALDAQVKKNTKAVAGVIEAGEKVGEKLLDLDKQVKVNADAVAAEETARKEADKGSLRVNPDGVISKVSNDDGSNPGFVDKLVLNKDDKNQITLSGDGIKVGLNSGVMDKDGFYAGGDTADKAMAALKADGSIKGANGDFEVNGDGKVTAKGGVETGGAEIKTGGGSITAGKITGTELNTQGGAITGGMATVTGLTTQGGDISGGDITATGLNTQGGEINGGDIKSSGTIHATGKITGNGLDAGTGAISGGSLSVTGAMEGNSLTLKGGNLDAGSGTITTTGDINGNNINTTGKITTKDLEVTGGLKTDHITLGSEDLNQTDINKGKVTSKIHEISGAVEYTAESIFNKDGSSITVRTNEGRVDSTGSSTVGSQIITQYLGNNAVPGGNNVTRRMVRNDNGTFSMVDTAVNGKDKYSIVSQNAEERMVTVTDGKNTTSTKQTAADIKNTAENGMISNTAKNLVNTATENMTNTVGKNLETTVGGEMKTTVTGNVTEDFKADLSTKVGGDETHAVTGNQTTTVSGNRTVNVKGTETENFNAQVTNVKTDQKTSVGGNQTNIVTGNQQNTVSGSKTETVKKAVTEKYGSQATTVDGDQSTNVGGNQSNVVKGNQTNTISGNKTETVKGEVTEKYGSLTTEVKGESKLSAANITNSAKEKLSNSAADIENIASKSITDKVGDNVERTMTTEQIQDKVGKTTVTTTDGLTKLTDEDHNHTTEMDYANVTKDLSVERNTTLGKEGEDTNLTVNSKSEFKDTVKMDSTLEVDGTSKFNDKVTITKNGLDVTGGTTTDKLEVKGTSEFGGKAAFKDDVSMGKNLTVTGETETGILHVNGDGYVGGDLNVEGNIETHDAELSENSRQVVTGRQLYQTNERVDRLDNRIKKVGANAAALAALRPGDFNPDDKFSIAAGFGSYRNANAAALGLFYRPNENVLLSLGTSFGDGENMVNAGVSVKFGRGKSMAERRKEMADEVSSMRDEMRSQDERIAELEEMLKKQSELIEKLSKES